MSVDLTAQGSYYRVWRSNSDWADPAEAEARAAELRAADPTKPVELSYNWKASKRWWVWVQQSQHQNDREAYENASEFEEEDPSVETRVSQPDVSADKAETGRQSKVGEVIRFSVVSTRPDLVEIDPPYVDVRIIGDGGFTIGLGEAAP